MKPDIILTPLRDFTIGLLQAQDTGMSVARMIGYTLCFCPEITASSHAGFDLADHLSYHRIAQGPPMQSVTSPPNIQTP